MEVTEVDFFISHVWDASRWSKGLALCYYINCNSACVASGTVWAAGVAYIIATKGLYGNAGTGQTDNLLLLLLYFPTLTFLVAFVTAHRFYVFDKRTVWLDKLCIHQTRENMRADGIAALPEFVANSKRMLILQSETYFERLWCNLELGTFCALHGVSKVDFVPLWLAPWMLLSIILNTVAMVLMMKLSFIVPYWMALVEAHLGKDGIWTFISFMVGCGSLAAVAFLPVVLIQYEAMRQKIRLHDKAAKQMKEFDLAYAKCTDEGDRSVVERHIAKLFNEHPHLGISRIGATEVGPIARFNYYVNHEFHEEVEGKLGTVTQLPFSTVAVSCLPMHFAWVVNVLSCDDETCKESAISEGYQSVEAYMLCNSLSWIMSNLFVFPSVYAASLQSLVRLSGCTSSSGCAGRLQKGMETACGLLCVLFWYTTTGVKYGAIQAALSLTVIDTNPFNVGLLISTTMAITCHFLILYDGGRLWSKLRSALNPRRSLGAFGPQDWTYLDV